MPPALIAIAAAAATVAVKIFVSSAILAAILTVAISVAASALIAKSQAKKVNQGTELSLKLDATYSREFPVGTTATGGSVNWAFTYTNDSKKPNRYLVRIIALSDLPVDGVIEVRSGDAVLSFTGDITTGLRACNQHLSKAGSPMLYIRVYKGSSAAVADSDLISWSGGQWTASHKGTNMCYAIVRSDYDADAFPNGEAQLRFTLRGVKIYDDRLDGSKPSRSGAHRLATPSTWEYSENTANIIAQLLRGFESNGVLIAGAQAEERDLSDSMLLSAYNTCDQLVSEGAGAGTIKRYASGMMVRSSDATASSLVELQSSMDGAVRDRGGAITILPGAVRTPVFHLTDTDVIWTEERSWQPQSSLSDLQNHFIGTFVDGLNGYTEKDFPPYKNAAWEVDDGGERFSTQVSFRAVTHWSRAQRIIKRMAASSRLQGTVAFVLPLLKGLQLEQGDWFTMTSARWGFTTKYFEVVKADISSDLKVAIVAKETASSLDGWSSVVDEVGRSDTTWNPPTWAIPAPDLAAAAFYYKDPISGHEDCGVTLTLTNFPSMQGITGIEVEAALQSALGSPWKITTLAPSNQVYTYIGLSPSIAYAVRIRTSDGLRQGDWSSWVNFTTAAFVGGTLDAGDNLLTNAAMTLDSSGWTAAVNCVRTTPTTNDPAAFWRSTAGTDPEVYANSQMTRPLNGATRLFASLSVRANDITSSGKIVVKFYKNGVFDQTLDAMTALLPTTANTWIRGAGSVAVPAGCDGYQAYLLGSNGAVGSIIDMAAPRLAVTESGASVTLAVSGPSAANVNYNNAGTVIEATVDLEYVLAVAGVPASSGVVWTYQVISGTVNGNNSTSGSIALSGAGATTFSITAMTTSTAVVRIKGSYNGTPGTPLDVALTRVLAAAPPPGTDSVTKTSGFTAINTATFTDITGTLTLTTPAGKTATSTAVSLAPKMLPKTSDQQGPWNIEFKLQRLISAVWTDIGSVENSNPDPYIETLTDPVVTVSNAGTMSATISNTGLTASTSYSYRIVARMSTGSPSTNGSTMGFTGSVTITCP